MAKLYISTLLVASIGFCLVASFIGSSQMGQVDAAAQDEMPQFGFGAKILENAFNPIMQKMIRSSMELVTELAQVAQQMATSGMTPELADKIHQSLDSIDGHAKTIKLQYSLLLGLILWPLALLLCPVGCGLACLLCCLVSVVTVVVVGLLLLVGTILYSGPLAGMVPHQATHVVGTLVETLGSISGETFDAVAQLIAKGHTAQAAPVLGMMDHVISAFGSIGDQLKQILTHPNVSTELASDVYTVLRSVFSQLSALGVQTQDMAAKLPQASASLNATLAQLAQHIQVAMANIEK